MKRALLLTLTLLCAAPARGQDAAGWGYQVLMWQDRTPAQMRGLAALGFTGAKLGARDGVVNAPARAERQAAGLGFYLENIATDFYSAYHRWTPEHRETWAMDQARARYRKDPADTAAFRRQPGLLDPDWLARIATRLERVAQEQAPFHPLFYNLADEAGIGDLASAWDFDRSPEALAAFRTWLAGQYGSLEALNREWGSGYASWAAVVPETTDEAVARTDGNLAPWADFKAYMDVAFAAAVRVGAEAVRRGDKAGLAGLEGAQVPGWGGYDYALLAPSVDVMEIYDYGEALDLAMAFNPALHALRTSFGRGPAEVHAAWRHALHGGRGLVVWDEADDVVLPDGSPGPRGRELGALVAAIGPVAAKLGEPSPDGVAVLVSQASFRVQWLLDRRAGDHDWAARDAEREYDDNAWRASRRVMLGRLGALGVEPRLVGEAGLEAGVPDGVRVLLLPHAIALSDAAVVAIRAFMARGGTVLADTEPGLFDGHGRRRAAAPLPEVAHPFGLRPDGPDEPSALDALAVLLGKAGAVPRVAMLGAEGVRRGGVEARWFVGEDGAAVLSVQAVRPMAAASALVLRFPRPVRATSLRGGAVLGEGTELHLVLDAVEPLVMQLR